MLHPPAKLQQDYQSPLAIGIQRLVADPKQLHIAVIYKHDSGDFRLIHLGWHHDLRHEKWNSEYHWVELPNIEDEVQETVADLAVIVASKAEDHPIPYSIVFSPDEAFDPSGVFINGDDGRGLTCATFVLALFANCGLPIALRDSWPLGRKEDISWAEKILQLLGHFILKKFPNSLPSLVKQFQQRQSLRRYRPEEVAACAHRYAGEPVNFNDAAPVGAEILTLLPR